MEYARFRIKNGCSVVLEELRKQDLPAMMRVFNSVVAEGVYLPRNEGIPSLEIARRWYRDRIKAGLFYLAAKVNGELIGIATIEPRIGKSSHIAYFGIYLMKQFRNKGIGSKLLKTVIEIAGSKGFEKIQLTVFSSNRHAIHLYRRSGFQEVGRIKDGIKLPDGTYSDEIIMVLNLKA